MARTSDPNKCSKIQNSCKGVRLDVLSLRDIPLMHGNVLEALLIKNTPACSVAVLRQECLWQSHAHVVMQAGARASEGTPCGQKS